MIEYGDVEVRRERLTQLIGIEDKIWMQVEGFEKVFAIADEDLERQNDVKTSAVHFMRFQLTPAMIIAADDGAKVFAGSDHENMLVTRLELDTATRDSLVGDLQRPTLN